MLISKATVVAAAMDLNEQAADLRLSVMGVFR
jgi:hypothetical protein